MFSDMVAQSSYEAERTWTIRLIDAEIERWYQEISFSDTTADGAIQALTELKQKLINQDHWKLPYPKVEQKEA